MNNIYKLLLFNQYEILKRLNPEDKVTYEQNQKTLEYGSDSDIVELYNYLIGTPEHVKEETFAIMQMFSDLEYAFNRIPGIDEKYKYYVTFMGFDGNEEVEHFSYCKHLVNDLGRYSEFHGRDLNTHSSSLNRYRSMLLRYNDIKEKRPCPFYNTPITIDELQYIIDA